MMMNFDEDEVCFCSLVRLELVQEDGFNRLELIALNERRGQAKGFLLTSLFKIATAISIMPIILNTECRNAVNSE